MKIFKKDNIEMIIFCGLFKLIFLLNYKIEYLFERILKKIGKYHLTFYFKTGKIHFSSMFMATYINLYLFFIIEGIMH